VGRRVLSKTRIKLSLIHSLQLQNIRNNIKGSLKNGDGGVKECGLLREHGQKCLDHQLQWRAERDFISIDGPGRFFQKTSGPLGIPPRRERMQQRALRSNKTWGLQGADTKKVRERLKKMT